MIVRPRILRENKKLLEETIPGVIVKQLDNSLRYYQIDFIGQKDTLYEGGIFRTELFLPDQYPFCPPKMRFITKIFHPNIDKFGRVHLNILSLNWSPSLRITTIIIAIQSRLEFPVPNDQIVPFDSIVSESWTNDPLQAYRTARDWCTKYAST